MSGEFEVVKDLWNGIDLEIYYHKKHPYNIERMMKGMKAGLKYCSENFSPYQFKQLRIVEFSQTGGATAHGFPGTIPFGEGAGFIADVDDSDLGGVDYAFGTAVHETAHEWWGHQVLPADVLGSKMIVESLAEYVNVKVKEKEKGIQKTRNYLKHNMKTYLELRGHSNNQESPLIYTRPNQGFVYYPKGAIVFNAISDYIGEQKLNDALKAYVEQVAFQEVTYTTSLELVDYIRRAVPDSLQYMIKDLFETVTLYDNKISNWEYTQLENGTYQVDINLLVSKYRDNGFGKLSFSDNGIDSLSCLDPKTDEQILSLPLNDYLEIGIFGEEQEVLHLQKYKLDNIINTKSIIVDKMPLKVGIDPYFKLIDRNLTDNISKTPN